MSRRAARESLVKAEERSRNQTSGQDDARLRHGASLSRDAWWRSGQRQRCRPRQWPQWCRLEGTGERLHSSSQSQSIASRASRLRRGDRLGNVGHNAIGWRLRRSGRYGRSECGGRWSRQGARGAGRAARFGQVGLRWGCGAEGRSRPWRRGGPGTMPREPQEVS